jgi:hypothetical protein
MNNIDWKKIAVGTSGVLACTAVGAALITLVGYNVDGDETFVIETTGESNKRLAIVKSCRGGLFAHAHKLDNISGDSDLKFTIKRELYHFHALEDDVYEITYDSTKNNCIITTATGDKKDNLSKNGGGHTHGLEVVCYIEDGTVKPLKN